MQFHRFRLALALSAGPLAFLTTPSILAQKELCLEPFAWGACKWLPVSRFTFARPFAVSPAPWLVGNFSPFLILSWTSPPCFFPAAALKSAVVGADNNTSIGYLSLWSNSTGYNNTAVGTYAGYSVTTGHDNVLIGLSAGENLGGHYNVGIGNATYGVSAGSANNRVAIGYQSQRVSQGNNNTSIGYQSLRSVTTGTGNVALGYQAGYSETSSDKLYIANSNTSTPLVAGDFANVRLGVNIAPGSLTANFHVKGSGNTSGTTALNIENSSSTSLMTILNDGKTGVGTPSPSYKLHVSGAVSGVSIFATDDIVAYSDERVKTDIQRITGSLDKIEQIEGVTYVRIDAEDDNTHRHAGVIAQQVEKVLPEVIETNKDGILSVAYGHMVGLLVEAIKEQDEKISRLEALVETLINKLGEK